MFDFTRAIKQGKLSAKGYCSLCGIEKATAKIGNRQVCEPCKVIWDVNPAYPFLAVMKAESLAVQDHEKKFGPL